MTVLELRQYTLRPGRREDLITLFDRELVTTQEEVGLTVVGQFRDLDDPDRFVWLRGFPDVASRAPALAAFYGGPVWREHRHAANATMVDSDDVLVLRPVEPRDELPFDPSLRRTGAVPSGAAPSGVVAITVLPFAAAPTGSTVALARAALTPDNGNAWVWETEPAPNEFPALPVREGEQVLAVIALFDDATAHGHHHEGLTRGQAWDRLRAELTGPPQHLRLAPTTASALR